MQPLPAPTAVVADDERLMREQIIARLKDAWPELLIVGEASNGREAIAIVQSLEPDIVFLDISMPDVDGIRAAQALAGQAQALAEKDEHRRLNVKTFREATGISRHLSVPLVEFFDHIGFTKRDPEGRKIRRDAREMFGPGDVS